VINWLAAAAFSLLVGCSGNPPKEQEPNIVQQKRQPEFRFNSSYRNLVETYADRIVREYVFPDVPVFKLDGDRLTLANGSLANFKSERINITNRRFEVSIPVNPDDDTIKILRAFLNLPLEIPYNFYLQEITIDQNTYLIPAAWFDYSKRPEIQKADLILGNPKEFMLSLIREGVFPYDLGVKVDKNSLKNELKLEKNRRETSIADVRKYLEQNDFFTAQEINKLFRNGDVRVLEVLANDTGIEEMRVLEIRTTYLTKNRVINTGNYGRFLLAIKYTDGRIKVFVIYNNYNSGKILRQVLRPILNNPSFHHRLRHTIDFPPSMATRMANITEGVFNYLLDNRNILEELANNRGARAISVNGLNVNILKVTGGGAGQYLVTTEIEIPIDDRNKFKTSVGYVINKYGNFGTWYPLGSMKEGLTLSSEKVLNALSNIQSYLEQRIREQERISPNEPVAYGDPYLQATMGFAFSIYLTTLENRIYWKNSFLNLINSEQDLREKFIELVKNYDYFIIFFTNKNGERLFFEFYPHSSNNVSLSDTEVGHFMTGNIFSVNPSDLGLELYKKNGDPIVYINCGVITHPDEFERDVIDQGSFEKLKINEITIYLPKKQESRN